MSRNSQEFSVKTLFLMNPHSVPQGAMAAAGLVCGAAGQCLDRRVLGGPGGGGVR